MLFESNKIVLRKMTSEDTALYHQWRNDIEVMRSTSPLLDVYNIKETEEFVTNVILGSHSSRSYIIVEKKSEKPIGITSLINLDYKNRNAECIIDIGDKEAWGKGYGAEALKLLLDFGFLEMNLHRISLSVFSFNSRAVKLYEKLGFQREGKLRESIFRDGQWHDILQMSILKNEYVKEKK
jgi:RimJ/RimL family protein N-acetyltransferase